MDRELEPITVNTERIVKGTTEEYQEDRTKELADIIYVFVPSKQAGFMFYSRSPKSALKTGVYETDTVSIQNATWDDSVNSTTGPTLMKVRNGGSVTICTYIVSEENYFKLINEIKNQAGNDRIRIDIASKLNINLVDKYDNYNDFANFENPYNIKKDYTYPEDDNVNVL